MKWRDRLLKGLCAATLFALAFNISCSDRKLARFQIVERFTQGAEVKIDILWILDNSTSMDEENPLVQAGSNQFINALVTSNANYHLGVLTMNVWQQTAGAVEQAGKLQAPTGVPSFLDSDTSTPTEIIDNFNSILQFVQFDPSIGGSEVESLSVGRGCEAGLESAVLAVDPFLDRNPGFLRAESFLAMIFLTDENDASTAENLSTDPNIGDFCSFNTRAQFSKNHKTVQQYLDYFNNLKDANYAFHGFLTLDQACIDAGALELSTNFIQAIDETGGFKASICNSDFSTLLNDLGLQIAQLASRFPARLPIDPTTLHVFVDDVEIASTGYTIDATERGVNLVTTPAVGAEIRLEYFAKTVGEPLLN